MSNAVKGMCVVLFASLAHAQSVSVPSGTVIYPPTHVGESSFELSLPLATQIAVPILAQFEGSLDNGSLTNPANVSLWFGWTDADGTSHATNPESLSLGPNLLLAQPIPGQPFLRDLAIPYSPAEISIHFVNMTSDWTAAVGISGTLSIVPEPGAITLLVGGASILLFSPRYRFTGAA